MKPSFFLIPLAFLACSSPAPKTDNELIDEAPPKSVEINLDSITKARGVVGAVQIVSLKTGTIWEYNRKDFDTPRTPASTYKIFNSLVGLESGVIKDENFMIKWDGKKRWKEDWNQDHTLQMAYDHSAVWYYQELARRVGGERMKHYLDTAGYGNADTTGGIDQFWLNNSLKITINQQVDFLSKLARNQVPFSQRSVDILKKVMIRQDSAGQVERAKTGWGFMDDSTNVGWYVGYITTAQDTLVFASCFQAPQPEPADFAQLRIEIARYALRKTGAYH